VPGSIDPVELTAVLEHAYAQALKPLGLEITRQIREEPLSVSRPIVTALFELDKVSAD
jgi:hypothetical protein